MLSLVIIESALELVPKTIQNHSSIISHAKKLEKNPSDILLDNSWHFAAMKGIENEFKRGRPDIVHLCLLEACTIPLYLENKIKVFSSYTR
jgi:rRNA small subunit pseudouridine methyltransferase Nep1